MITIYSLPMFIASSTNIIFFIIFLIYIILCFKSRENHKYYESYIIFTILAFVNFIYALNFGLLLNLGSNLDLLNITNRITLISSAFVITLLIHFSKIFFKIKDRGLIYYFYGFDFIFAVLLSINTPLCLYKQFYKTCDYYTGLKFGPLFNIWGVYMLFLLIYAFSFLIYGFIKFRKKFNNERYPFFILIFASLSLIIAGALDALTAIRITDLPPLSWIGSLTIALSIGIVLIMTIEELNQKNKELYEEVIHDSLTNAFSRSYFEVEYEKTFNLLNRENHNNYLVILDIDNFKNINDTYGHLAGDHVLINLAGIIKENLRSTDIFGRFGGDEFVILIKNVPDDNTALHSINRLKENIQLYPFKYKRHKINITCSFGVVNFNQSIYNKNINKENVFAVADTALYKSKELGKNRIEFLNPAEQVNII